MGKNVAVFVDVANIFYAAKAAGVDIDYVTLLKSASAGRDLVRAYAYTGLDPDNENQRNFHDFLRRSNYKVVSKDIRKYGDGKVKANLDIELVVDMMKTARNLDIAIVVSGDGDFAPAIRAVQEQGVRVEVISFRGNTSSDLIEVADQFTDIIQLARVEKGSRSGRRVADGDTDLSMTEVPDKQTEGTGDRRGSRGGASRGGRGRGRGRERVETEVAASNGGGEGVLALPGERLSKATGRLTEADLARAEVFTLDDLEATSAPDDAGAPREGGLSTDGDEAGRRRRRRGGRGRGRGRGRDGEVVSEEAPIPSAFDADVEDPEDAEDDEDVQAPVAPRGPRSTPFGSVWDSQLGTPTTPAANLQPLSDDEDFDEPEIPEYLIAEQRRGQGGRGGAARGGRGGGPRGGRSAYQSAIERERYGGGRSGGLNRYPDVSGRTPAGSGSTGGRAQRDDRSPGRGGSAGRDRFERPRDDQTRTAAPRPGSSEEPWSEVPPELEARLRAQVGQKPAAPAAPSTPSDPDDALIDATPPATLETADAETVVAPKRRTARTRAKASEPTAEAEAPSAEPTAEADEAPKRRTTRSRAKAGPAEEPAATTEAPDAPAEEAAAPKRRSTRSRAAAAGADPAPPAGSAEAPTEDAATPKRRTTRTRKSAADEPA